MHNLSKNLEQLQQSWQGQTIMLVGLGKEAWSSYQFLSRNLTNTSLKLLLADAKPLHELDEKWQKIANSNRFFQLGITTLPWDTIDSVLVSPGVSAEKLTLVGLPTSVTIVSNTELFFRLIQDIPREELLTIGVTGTKGKSTTTAAIHHVLIENGFSSFLGGNIGVPLLDLYAEIDDDEKTLKQVVLVLELSSHQLSRLHYSPQIAVIQAITPEHLDYYPDFAHYLEAKSAICRYQHQDDLVLFNADSETAAQLAHLSPGQRQGFKSDQLPLSSKDSTLPGAHNLINLTPAVLVGNYLNIPPENITASIKTFKGLPHRLQIVAKKEDVTYVNDSLATTPEATMAAIQSFDCPVILIAGGYDRGLEYQTLGQFLSDESKSGHIKGLVLFPPSGDRIQAAMQQVTVPMILVKTMTAAVEEATKIALPQDVVLLSPASASFGRFKDYADRGEQFIQAVSGI